MGRAHGCAAFADGCPAHHGLDAGLPHMGERAFGSAALAGVEVLEVLRIGKDIVGSISVAG